MDFSLRIIHLLHTRRLRVYSGNAVNSGHDGLSANSVASASRTSVHFHRVVRTNSGANTRANHRQAIAAPRSGKGIAQRSYSCHSGRAGAESRAVRHQRDHAGREAALWFERKSALYPGLERQAADHSRGLCPAAGGDSDLDHQRSGRRHDQQRRRAGRRPDSAWLRRPHDERAPLSLPGACSD